VKNVFKIRHLKLLAIAIPMVLSNIAAPLLGLVDTAIIGHLPDAIYLSAVALGAMVVSFTYLLLVFLRMSTTGLSADAFGARDRAKLQQVWCDAILFALLLAAFIWLVKPLVLIATWQLVEASPELQALTTQYIEIRYWSAPAALFMLVNLGVLLAIQRVKQAMILVVITNLLNVFGDIVLIIYLDMNVVGAAWASVIAEYVTATLGTWWVIRAIDLKFHDMPRFAPLRLRKLAYMNSDIFIRSVMLHFAMAMMTAWASYYGEVFIAANAVLLQFLMLISLGLDGIAYAAEALVGRAKGRRSSQQIQLWTRLSLQWSVGLALCYSLIFYVFGGAIIELITDIPEVIDTARNYLPWIVVLPLLAHWSYWFDGIFIGLSASKAMRNTMVFSTVVVFLPVWWFSQSLENHGLWLALCCFMVARGVSQAYVTWRRSLLTVTTN